MNNKIFAVTCDQFNLGTTFLIWSIHYCTNEKDFYSIADDEFVTISEDPFDGITAHKMRPNRYRPVFDVDAIINHSGGKLNHFRDFSKKYRDTGTSSTKPFLAKMETHGIKTINITCTGLQFLIGFLRFTYTEPNWQNNFDAVKKHCKHYWPRFFDDAHIYENRLTTWHDIREGIAFNIRPYQIPAIGNNNKNIYDCEFEDLLTNGKKEILNILDFLDLKAHTPNLDHWCDMHDIWKGYLHHYINFCNDIEMIIESILKNKSIDLEQYRMDVLKEGVLLHLLMFKHGLNLTKSIEKLPHNTQEIFKLLGKNDRTGIQKIY
jgi:hypothetical protein